MQMIDAAARERALTRYGFPPCLCVPIAAVDEAAIRSYVGEIVQTLSGAGTRRAFLVRAYPPPAIDLCFPIWDEPRADILHRSLQVWVQIDFTRYRKAYRRGLPAEELGDAVLSHAMNRRVARLRGFNFVRLTPTSRSANSSSAFSEGWGVTQHSTPSQMEQNRRSGMFIAYADLTELMLMLDMKLGGGVMDAVNEGQRLVRPKPAEQRGGA